MPLGNVIRAIGSTPTTASSITESYGTTPDSTASLNAQGLPALQLTFQTQCLFTLFAEISLGAAGQQLGVRVVMLELLDVAKEPFNFIASSVDIVIQLGVHLVSPVDLGLEVLDSAINIAKRALLGAVLALLVFQVGFKLNGQVSTKLTKIGHRAGLTYLLDSLMQEANVLATRRIALGFKINTPELSLLQLLLNCRLVLEELGVSLPLSSDLLLHFRCQGVCAAHLANRGSRNIFLLRNSGLELKKLTVHTGSVPHRGAFALGKVLKSLASFLSFRSRSRSA